MDEGERIIHPQALPNYESAEIKREKLEGYVLNPDHQEGRHKARVFKSALGFDQLHWETLKQKILEALPYHEAIPKPEGPWGKKYEVRLSITGLTGRTAIVETVWIIRPKTDYPSLVTALVAKERDKP